MRKITLLTSVLLTAPFAAGNVSAQCVATQDCATLGYTETSCESGGVKCPFGDKWACIENKIQNTPSIGDILYADKTTSPDVISSKKPIGIVIDAKKRLAVALEIQPTVSWQKDDPNNTSDWNCNQAIFVDIPSLPNCIVADLTSVNATNNITCESNGKQNTDKIINYGKEKNLLFPAAEYCYEYTPSGCTEEWCGKGQWFLPSMLQVTEFFKSMIIYTYQMKALKKPDYNIYQYTYWTSNEKASEYAYWCKIQSNPPITFKCGYSGNHLPKCNFRAVLPFIEF